MDFSTNAMSYPVLSHNCFKSLSLKKLSKLTKLSLSNNSLRDIPDTQVPKLLCVHVSECLFVYLYVWPDVKVLHL